jgi:hypothetical protein
MCSLVTCCVSISCNLALGHSHSHFDLPVICCSVGATDGSKEIKFRVEPNIDKLTSKSRYIPLRYRSDALLNQAQRLRNSHDDFDLKSLPLTHDVRQRLCSLHKVLLICPAETRWHGIFQMAKVRI